MEGRIKMNLVNIKKRQQFDDDLTLLDKIMSIYSILLPHHHRKTEREKEFLSVSVLLARKGITNLKSKKAVAILKERFGKRTYCKYRQQLIKKGWLLEEDGQIRIINEFDRLVKSNVDRGYLFQLKFLKSESGFNDALNN